MITLERASTEKNTLVFDASRRNRSRIFDHQCKVFELTIKNLTHFCRNFWKEKTLGHCKQNA